MKFASSSLCGLFIACLIVSATATHAMTIVPSAVSGTIRDNPKNGFPDSAFPGVFSVLQDPVNDDRGIVEFDISGLTGPVGQATLNLTRISPPATGFLVDVYGYTGNGTFELGDFSLGTLIASLALPVGPAISVDVTAFINGEIASMSGFAGFNLRAPVNSGSGVQFAPAPLPTLEIDAQAASEPGTLAILGIGLLGLGLARRVRTRKIFNR